jgi:penicillin-binding protein activator
MKKFKHAVVISLLAFGLAGCQLLGYNQKTEVKEVPVETPDDTAVVDTPPLIVKTTDWNTILSPFVNKILQSSSAIDGNKVLLISDIQNRSGGYLAINKIDGTLHRLMDKQNIFTVADRQSIIQAKQALGISVDDKLISRSKMIGLAKSMNAGYVLFTTLYKSPSENDQANLSMELLSTQTGEILQRVTSKDIQPQVITDTDNVQGAGE